MTCRQPQTIPRASTTDRSKGRRAQIRSWSIGARVRALEPWVTSPRRESIRIRLTQTHIATAATTRIRRNRLQGARKNE